MENHGIVFLNFCGNPVNTSAAYIQMQFRIHLLKEQYDLGPY